MLHTSLDNTLYVVWYCKYIVTSVFGAAEESRAGGSIQQVRCSNEDVHGKDDEEKKRYRCSRERREKGGLKGWGKCLKMALCDYKDKQEKDRPRGDHIEISKWTGQREKSLSGVKLSHRNPSLHAHIRSFNDEINNSVWGHGLVLFFIFYFLFFFFRWFLFPLCFFETDRTDRVHRLARDELAANLWQESPKSGPKKTIAPKPASPCVSELVRFQIPSAWSLVDPINSGE
jgi:hypothetical protein